MLPLQILATIGLFSFCCPIGLEPIFFAAIKKIIMDGRIKSGHDE